MARRIVIACWGSYGDLFPYIGLGTALARRGLQVVLAAPGYYGALAARTGLELHPVGPDVDPEDRDRIARVMHPARGSEAIFREWLMPAVGRSFAELEAVVRATDLVVSHPVTFAAPVVAQTRQVPWVSTVLAPMSFFSAFDPPVISGAPWGIRLLRLLGPWHGRAVAALARRATRRWAGPVFALRQSLGLPAGSHPLFEGQFSPWLTLALFSRVLAAPAPDWPDRVIQPGFISYTGPDPLPPALDAFLEEGSPPVVFTLGSSAVMGSGAARFYEQSAAAARRLGRRAVLLTGLRPENQPPVDGKDVMCVPHAPHDRLFPRAAAVVHHGGIGTTGQVLRAGCPMLVVPHAHDQPDNAERARRLGVSRTLHPDRYGDERVARELDVLLRNPAYAARSRDIAGVVRNEGGAEEAADHIAALASP
jgi:UDP:flavonoid glycosyltransferase YjiC (YdhE family)